MKRYHEIWLAAHSDRDEEWLKDKLDDGFDIHHADGNHQNNDPANLVLIEAADHAKLHGGLLEKMMNGGRKARFKRRSRLEIVCPDLRPNGNHP